MPSSASCLHLSARSYWQHERVMSAPIRALVLAALAVCSLSSVTAHAQFFSWLHYRSWRGEHTPFRHKHQHGRTQSELAKKAEPQDTPKGPLQIIISIADQQISLYDNGAPIARSSVSTGVQGHRTPLGVFSVISKERWHRSNIYSGAPMPRPLSFLITALVMRREKIRISLW